MREQADEQAIIEERSGSFNSSFINVHDVSDFLKRIKRNPRGKDNANQRERNIVKSQIIQHAEEGTSKEVKIFENAENGEIQNQGKKEPFPAMRMLDGRGNVLSDQKIDHGAANHEEEKAPVPPTVKEVAGQEEKNVLGAMVQPPVEENDGNQEKKERRRVKKHGTQSD